METRDPTGESAVDIGRRKVVVPQHLKNHEGKRLKTCGGTNMEAAVWLKGSLQTTYGSKGAGRRPDSFTTGEVREASPMKFRNVYRTRSCKYDVFGPMPANIPGATSSLYWLEHRPRTAPVTRLHIPTCPDTPVQPRKQRPIPGRKKPHRFTSSTGKIFLMRIKALQI
eukprot:TRINITY_DN38337_c0_g1_i1.p1 TRINITY_DN38337_c0_g1~~TRINITY_DN38337_c0_g1_i1.p1  ORF type:complete len:168 (+),score=19.32 TRINITY_DN38337_c0_g1_i1:53-556(+)